MRVDDVLDGGLREHILPSRLAPERVEPRLESPVLLVPLSQTIFSPLTRHAAPSEQRTVLLVLRLQVRITTLQVHQVSIEFLCE